MTTSQVFVAGMIAGAVAMTVLLLFLLPLERHDGRHP